VWLLSINIALLTLVFSKVQELQTKYTLNSIKFFMLLLILSILSGLIYRLSSFVSIRYLFNSKLYIDIVFSEKLDIPVSNLKEVEESSNIYFIISEIKSIGGKFENEDKTIDIYEKNKDKILISLKDFYKELDNRNQNVAEKALNFILETYRKSIGLNEKDYEKIKLGIKENNKYFILNDKYVFPLSFIMSCIFFISSIVIVVIGLINF
jgi:hypothetical protein